MIRWNRPFEHISEEALHKLEAFPCSPYPSPNAPSPEIIAFAKWRYCLSNRLVPMHLWCVSCKAHHELRKRLEDQEFELSRMSFSLTSKP